MVSLKPSYIKLEVYVSSVVICKCMCVYTDRPCLEDRDRVLRVRKDVELALSHILHRDNQESLLHKVCASVRGQVFAVHVKDGTTNTISTSITTNARGLLPPHSSLSSVLSSGYCIFPCPTHITVGLLPFHWL